MLIFGEGHVRLVLAEYQAHYNGRRPPRSRQLHPPRPDFSVADLSRKRIKSRPVLGGLLNEYERAAEQPRKSLVAEFWIPTVSRGLMTALVPGDRELRPSAPQPAVVPGAAY